MSEAYSILGSVDKRALYDRDYARSVSPNTASIYRGSYSSASRNPAGGRPASGLSRRRTKFQGPPPSFYASTNPSSSAKSKTGHESTRHATPGIGPSGFTFASDDQIPHFDREGHFRTQETILSNARRRAKWKRAPGTFDHLEEHEIQGERESEGKAAPSVLISFMLVSGVLVSVWWATALLGSITRPNGGSNERRRFKET